MSQQLATFQLRKSVQSANSNSHLQGREGRVRILTSVRMVTDPGLIVIENTEAFTATVAPVAIAVASIGVRLVLWDEFPLAEAEVAETALIWCVRLVDAIFALPARAVAKSHCTGWQQTRCTSDADVTATTMLAIDTSRKDMRWCRRRSWSRCQRRSRFRIATAWRGGSN